MLISLRSDHKDHLQLLTTQSAQVIADFCNLGSDYLQNGPNRKLYSTAAAKLEVTIDVIQNSIFGIINLLLLASAHQLSDVDFRDSVLTLGFSPEQEVILSTFYDLKKHELEEIGRTYLTEPHYHDLQWRFEVQLASRCLLQHVTPLVAMNLTLKTRKYDESELQFTHELLQTDPTNLLHITNELENALNESRSRHCRNIERTLTNLQQ